MKYLITVTKRLVLSLLLFHSSTLLHAATPGNYAEMGLALATIPFDMAAHKSALNDNHRRAAFLHLITDTLSLANKTCFFYNNVHAQLQVQDNPSLLSRDILVNGTLAAIDAKNLLKHFKQFIAAKKKPVDDLLDDDLDFEVDELDELDKLDQEGQKKISRLAYNWKVIALPSLKGLSAFAVACAQQGATDFSNVYARNLTTAAHSFIKLLSEYSALEVSSDYKTVLSAALIVNATWLVYEAKQYYSRPAPVPPQRPQPPVPGPVPPVPVQPQNEPYAPMPKVQGECPVCFDDEELDQLHCGHACCRNCLRGQLQTAYNDRGVQPFHRVRCSDPNCQAVISRNELREITAENADMLRAYDEAVNPPVLQGGADNLTDDEIRRAGHKRCPNPVCRVPIEKGDGCRHIVCTRCNHNFCWWCLGDDYDYQHEQNGCTNINRQGANPNIPQTWDYLRPSLQDRPALRPRPMYQWD